jgi:hypothetical protein
MSDGVHPIRLPGGDLVIPGEWCAMLQELLRPAKTPEMRELRGFALEAARDRTARVKGTSGVGIPGVAAVNGRGAGSERPAAVSTQEAAVRLGTTKRNVVGLCTRGSLPGAWQDLEGRWFIPVSAIEDRRMNDGERGGTSGRDRAPS